jgi:phosphoserine phosphatase RsbU/P
VAHEYANHILDDAQATAFYITTDGFLDEGGGEKGYSFGEERFRAMLQALGTRPMAAQADIFERTLREFRGQRKQRDDITVVGFRLQAPRGEYDGPVQDP